MTVPNPTGPGGLPQPGEPGPGAPAPVDPAPIDPDRPPVPLDPPPTPEPGPVNPDPGRPFPGPGPVSPDPTAPQPGPASPDPTAPGPMPVPRPRSLPDLGHCLRDRRSRSEGGQVRTGRRCRRPGLTARPRDRACGYAGATTGHRAFGYAGATQVTEGSAMPARWPWSALRGCAPARDTRRPPTPPGRARRSAHRRPPRR